MGVWVFRILAAVGAVAVVIMVGTAAMVLISWMIDRRN